MTISTSVFDKWRQGQINGAHFTDLDTDSLKVTLHTVAWTPDLAANEFFTDAAHELGSGSGYTAGGVALATKVVGLDASHFAYLTADPVTWSALTATFRYAVLRKDTGSAATSPLILLIDFGADQSPAGVDTVIQWPVAGSGGILKVA